MQITQERAPYDPISIKLDTKEEAMRFFAIIKKIEEFIKIEKIGGTDGNILKILTGGEESLILEISSLSKNSLMQI